MLSFNKSVSDYPPCVSEDRVYWMTILMKYIVPVLFGIIDIIGFFGNLLVIIVIMGYASMRNSTNILIGSLALADLSFIIFCVPMTAAIYFLETFPLSEVYCKIYNFFTYFSLYCSVYTLVLMCLDRFLAVVFPLQSRMWRTTKHTVIAVIILWIILIFVSAPIAYSVKILYGVQHENQTLPCQMRVCQISWFFNYNEENVIEYYHNDRGRIFYGLFFAFGYAFPLALICMFYSFLIKELLFGRISRMSKSAESYKGKKRATRLVIVVVLVFALCWLPIQLVFLVQAFVDDNDSFAFRLAQIIGNILSYANSCVNPILYAFCSKNFRTGFAALLCIDRLAIQQIRSETTIHPDALKESHQLVATESVGLSDMTELNQQVADRKPNKSITFTQRAFVHLQRKNSL